MFEKLKIVEVKWQDVMVYSDRVPLSKAIEAKCSVCRTTGFAIYEDNMCIILAQSLQYIPGFSEICTSEYAVIPNGCIISRKELQENDESNA